MGRKDIPEHTKRRLYAESMGRCMNPSCQIKLFINESDIIEKAHIVPYSKTEDNSFENLVVLCPNCHTKYDKGDVFTSSEILNWKSIRQAELNRFFAKKYNSFEELEVAIKPLLKENKTIYENYYLKNENKKMWDQFEPLILSNNEKIKTILKNNLKLLQDSNEGYSNLKEVEQLILHIDEFKLTRGNQEKERAVLFPQKINSIFGIEPLHNNIFNSVDSIQNLINILKRNQTLFSYNFTSENPHLILNNDEIIYLDDEPRLMQIMKNHKSFKRKSSEFHMKSYFWILGVLKEHNIPFIVNTSNIKEIVIKQKSILLVYEYVLTKAFLMRLQPKHGSIIINLSYWNYTASISQDAYDYADEIGIKLLTSSNFLKYIYKVYKD